MSGLKEFRPKDTMIPLYLKEKSLELCLIAISLLSSWVISTQVLESIRLNLEKMK